MSDAKLVPGDPTPEMVDAVCSIPVAGPYLGTDDAVDIWMAFYEAADVAAPQPAASDVPHDVVRALEEALEEALELLQEKRHGNPARSPGHNAQHAIKRALAALATPAPSTSTEEALRAENARLIEALTQIGERSLPSQPATDAGDELSWAQRQYAQLRAIALSALSR